ncbi:MAG: glycine zipper 2TM domain-containing protein [Rhodoferax sp.]|uniref:glycine zipper 2TM domain-containing protein n=1 Tax=Rhodoferax sp. TaxID=50421 RepID=UPI0027364F30|nr:glycine zipper 2TM domain-containing protein [Rhodoferax sp.]MDP2681008.1 glycine zipper 2TM domain-containing protein [Rhodoferax sp.]
MKTLNKLTASSAIAATLMLGACADMNSPAYPNAGTAYPQQSTSSYTQYGVVQTITLVPQNSTSTPIGAGTIAGAVVGGILGHQVGSGSGNTAATVLGAAGGAYAGHELEKRNQTQQGSVYQLTIRLNNGSYQTLTQSSHNDIRVGDSVRIDNGVAQRY